MGWRSLKTFPLDVALGEYVLMDFLIFTRSGFLVRGSSWGFVQILQSNPGSLGSGLLRWELQRGNGASERQRARRWSSMLYLTPAEEKPLNREPLLTFGCASNALFSSQ